MTLRVPLEPPPGLTDDDTTFASPGQWADGSNIRFVKGRAETIGPWFPTFGTALTGVCRNIKAWTESDGVLDIAFGTHSALMVYTAGALADITPSGLTAGSIDNSGTAPGYGTGPYGEGTYSVPASAFYARTWSLDTFGENLVASPRGGTLYLWELDPTADATEVTNAPDEITAIMVTPERQVLALGCNEEVSDTFNALCIRGCDIEDIDDWTTAPDNNAFEHILEGSGAIVMGRMLGPYVVIWTNVALYIGQFIGSPGQTYRFDPVATNCGLIGPNAVQVIGQTAFWVGTDKQIRAWSPGAQPEIVNCPIWKDFADNMDDSQAAKLVVGGMSKFNEQWIFYPDTRDGPSTGSGQANENSRYLAVAVDAGTWFRGDMERTAFTDAGVASYPIGANSSGNVYSHENPNGDDIDWSLRTADTYIGEGDIVAEIQRFISDFEEQDNAISLNLSTRQWPRSIPVTKGPYSIAASAAKKDFRASGRIMAVELSGTGRMRLGRPLFEAVVRGTR